MKHTFWVFLFLALGAQMQAQNAAMPIGSWRTHLPYNVGKSVDMSAEAIFYATDWSLLVLNQKDLSTRFLSSVDGLSFTGINTIRYVPGSKTLVVAYTNAQIDLCRFDGDRMTGVYTLTQITNFRNFTGQKAINQIWVETDSTVLLATTYGISRLNVRSGEFVYTVFTGLPVRAAVLYNNELIVSTQEGIYSTPQDNPIKEDFQTWNRWDAEQGLPAEYKGNQLAIFQNSLYMGVDQTVYTRNGNTTQPIRTESGYNPAYFSPMQDGMLLGWQCAGGGCWRGKTQWLTPGNQIKNLADGCFGVPYYGVKDAQNRIWFADGWRGFRQLSSLDAGDCNFTEYDFPFSENAREITIGNKGEVWVASGGVNQTFSNRFLDHGLYHLKDGQWKVLNRNNTTAFRGRDKSDGWPGVGDDLLDFMSVAVHPTNGKVYAASFYEGLLEINGDTIKQYDDSNSSLSNAIGDDSRTRVSGLAFDKAGNLWASNHLAARPLSVLKPDGTWKAFSLPCGGTEMHQILVDDNGYKWMCTSSSQNGIVVYDTGTDINNTSDDRCREYNTNNSSLPTNKVNCLALDRNGAVWAGTSEGIVIFDCGSAVFEDLCSGDRNVVEQDGFGEYLFATGEITTIAVDGANRKWVGTRSGVYVLSPDGKELITSYTTVNSPLPDNSIIDISIDDASGDVFIATNKGIVSYRGESTGGGQVNTANIYAYPNPVRPDYTGPIAIKGLARDANVKITDVNGRLVYETNAFGGQAIWNGEDYNGKRVHTGVYLVFITSNSRYVGFGEPSTEVTRIVFIN